jgi:peptidoglycan/xylan/chitin deacetylase (PgdA/CDA1 family)
MEGGKLSDTVFIPILAYHEICDLPKEMRVKHSYNVPSSDFKEQMEFLRKNNYTIIALEKLVSFVTKKQELPRRSLVITFDDGYKKNYTEAFPILRQYNFPASIFLATDYIGTKEVFPWLSDLCAGDKKVKGNWIPLSWQEITEMSGDGITFGSHTCSHVNIRHVSKGTFEKEIEKSRNTIEGQISRQVNLFCYPVSFPEYRRCYRGVIQETRGILLRTGFVGACTTIIGTNSLSSDPFRLRRIQIRNSDNLFTFKAKLEGAYNWAGYVQKLYKKVFEAITDKRRRGLK